MVAERTETVFFTTLENVEGIACCVCSCKVISEVISLIKCDSRSKAAAVGYFTGSTVEADNEFEVFILSAEVPVTGGVHETCERATTIFRNDCIVDGFNFAEALSLSFDGSIVSYPAAVTVIKPAAAGNGSMTSLLFVVASPTT